MVKIRIDYLGGTELLLIRERMIYMVVITGRVVILLLPSAQNGFLNSYS